MVSTDNQPMKGKWIDLINESVQTMVGMDFRDIDAVA